MNWILYMIVFTCILFKSVHGLKVKQLSSVTVESNTDYEEGGFLEAGTRKTISCKGSNKNQKLEWIDPSGNLVESVSAHRVFVQDHFSRLRTPAAILIFTHAAVRDTGIWECRSDGLSQNVSLCVIDPSEFVDTSIEVTTNRYRSITLVCQARGDPEPRLVWYRDDEIITDDNNSTKYRVMTKYNSQGFEGLLTILSVEPEDSGMYTCAAIQENPLLEDCNNIESLNISLNVNSAPEFDDGSNVKTIYGKYNESVDLVCEASGFPSPTYRWFRTVSDRLSEEFPEKSIIFYDDKAILRLKADLTTLGRRYKCRATNAHGDAYKDFALLPIQSPNKPNEINISNYTEDSVQLNITWYDVEFFPVDVVLIQYIKKSNLRKKDEQPKGLDWRRGKHTTVSLDDVEVDSDFQGIFVTVKDLDIETEYWLRLRAYNDAGESPWSEPIEIYVPELEEGVTTNEPETLQASNFDVEGILYGIGFTAVVIVLAVGCMMIVKLL